MDGEVGVDRVRFGLGGLSEVWLSLLSLDWVKLGLGDCVWCVLLPKPVANATFSSRTTPPVSYS